MPPLETKHSSPARGKRPGPSRALFLWFAILVPLAAVLIVLVLSRLFSSDGQPALRGRSADVSVDAGLPSRAGAEDPAPPETVPIPFADRIRFAGGTPATGPSVPGGDPGHGRAPGPPAPAAMDLLGPAPAEDPLGLGLVLSVPLEIDRVRTVRPGRWYWTGRLAEEAAAGPAPTCAVQLQLVLWSYVLRIPRIVGRILVTEERDGCSFQADDPLRGSFDDESVSFAGALSFVPMPSSCGARPAAAYAIVCARPERIPEDSLPPLACRLRRNAGAETPVFLRPE